MTQARWLSSFLWKFLSLAPAWVKVILVQTLQPPEAHLKRQFNTYLRFLLALLHGQGLTLGGERKRSSLIHRQLALDEIQLFFCVY